MIKRVRGLMPVARTRWPVQLIVRPLKRASLKWLELRQALILLPVLPAALLW